MFSVNILEKGHFFIRIPKRHWVHFRQFVSIFIIFVFLLSSALPSHAQSALNLPVGVMVDPSPAFVPVLLKGMMIDSKNPLYFDFIVDSGNTKFTQDQIKEESSRLVKYFLSAVTIPQDDLWVNLSPYEEDRIVPDALGKTELGRDMLAQDYILKQLTASLIYPEKELGKKFWEKVYAKAYEKFGTTKIPADTFNKIWIVPQEAAIYESSNVVYIVKSRLKVMMEEDYVALQAKQRVDSREHIASSEKPLLNTNDQMLMTKNTPTSTLSSDIVREIILPEIEREVNEGKNFAPIRQIYQSLILAQWYKETIKESILSKVYIDQKKIKGVDLFDPTIKDQVYARYVESFKKGVFDFIKTEYDQPSQRIIPRKYFSGGEKFGKIPLNRIQKLGVSNSSPVGDDYKLSLQIDPIKNDIVTPEARDSETSSPIFSASQSGELSMEDFVHEYKEEIKKQLKSVSDIGIVSASKVERLSKLRPFLSADKRHYDRVSGVVLNPKYTGKSKVKKYTTRDYWFPSEEEEYSTTVYEVEIERKQYWTRQKSEWLENIIYRNSGMGLFNVVEEREMESSEFSGRDREVFEERRKNSVLFVVPIEDLKDYRAVDDSGYGDFGTGMSDSVGIGGEITTAGSIKLKPSHFVLAPKHLGEISAQVFSGNNSPRVIIVDSVKVGDSEYPDYESAIKLILKENPGVQYWAHIMRLPIATEFMESLSPDKRPREMLVRVMNNADKKNSLKAAIALAERGDVVAADKLVEIIKKFPDEIMRKSVLKNFFMINDLNKEDIVARLLNDEDFKKTRYDGLGKPFDRFVVELGSRGDERAIPYLKQIFLSGKTAGALDVLIDQGYRQKKNNFKKALDELRDVDLREGQRKDIDKALAAIEVKKDGNFTASSTLGGIDMNNIEMKRQGSGVDIQLDPVVMRDILDNGVDGFVPIIINLAPINSILHLLGIETSKEEEDDELSLLKQ